MQVKVTTKPNRIDEELRAAFEQLGKVGEAEAKMLAPVDTGELRDSINHSVTTSSNKLVIHLKADADHAAYVEPKQPFMSPAAELMEAQLVEIIEAAVKRGVR